MTGVKVRDTNHVKSHPAIQPFIAFSFTIPENKLLHHLTGVVTDFLQSLRQLDLGLDLGPELLHLPEVLHHLPPHDLDDGGGEGEAQEDVDSTDHHVESFICKCPVMSCHTPGVLLPSPAMAGVISPNPIVVEVMKLKTR